MAGNSRQPRQPQLKQKKYLRRKEKDCNASNDEVINREPVPHVSRPQKLWLDEIQKKQRSHREKALTLLVEAFTCAPRHKFVEENFSTIYYECLKRLTLKKIGSSQFSKTEVRLAVRAVSLIPVNLADVDRTFEVYDESLPILSDALDRFDQYEVDAVVEVLSCIGMLGFFGSRNSMEIEKAMLVVWNFLGGKTRVPSPVLGAAINTWSFLLTRLLGWNVGYKNWRDKVSYLATLLKNSSEDDDYESVVLAATDALALLFHMDFFNKNSHESEADKFHSLLQKDITRVFNQENSDLLVYIDHDYNNLSRIIQMKTIKRLLGEKGFASHVKQNKNFERLFEFMWRDDSGWEDETVYAPEREELVLKFYHGQPGKQTDADDLLPYVSAKEKQKQRRMIMSPSSCLNKARTQLLNKQRQLVDPVDHAFAESEYCY